MQERRSQRRGRVQRAWLGTVVGRLGWEEGLRRVDTGRLAGRRSGARRGALPLVVVQGPALRCQAVCRRGLGEGGRREALLRLLERRAAAWVEASPGGQHLPQARPRRGLGGDACARVRACSHARVWLACAKDVRVRGRVFLC